MAIPSLVDVAGIGDENKALDIVLNRSSLLALKIAILSRKIKTLAGLG